MSEHVVDDLENLIFRDVLNELGPDQSGEIEALSLRSILTLYGTWRSRLISPAPRTSHLSTDIVASAAYSKHRSVVDSIIAKSERGLNLMPHQSRRITTIYQPTTTRPAERNLRQDLDLLVSEWGIQHLHLSTIAGRNGLVAGTRELLFAVFRPRDVYFIGIFPHEWTNEEFVRICVRNWPGADLFHQVSSTNALANPSRPENRESLRTAGITSFLEVDGRVYMPPGQTAAGAPIAAARKSMQVIATLNDLRTSLALNSNHFSDQLVELGVVVHGKPIWVPSKRANQYGFVDAHSGVFIPVVTLLD